VRIVATGRAACIGSVVTEALIEQGHQALVLANLSQGHRNGVEPRTRRVPNFSRFSSG
jgi:UDP-glucose 4-epimerase